ncbi:MAG: hypothetical protein IJD98_01435 [Oscillospiraceae bacterium]|nr:hypothetical protein [Oscillospiraceae bacterium]
MQFKKWIAAALALVMVMSLCACDQKEEPVQQTEAASAQTEEPSAPAQQEENLEKANIEWILNLDNNGAQEWTYKENADAWVLSAVSAVAYPELPDQQGVSVCVPGAYVKGIDTNRDGNADVTSGTAKGSLVIDYDAQITSTNGQVYTAATAPVILNTGAAGYGSQYNSAASTSHAADGYINVSCGNRGKQDSAKDADGNSYYTGDAPSCLVDQKAAARFVKYNILLGNLPGNVDYFVSTGGSGGGAHAAMFAATGNNPDFYDYQIEAGAVGVYKNSDGTYSTTVTIDGVDYEISDGAWGCIAYSAITSLYEADMALAFEYYLNTEYSFGSPFQAQLAEYLSESYMEYINEQKLSVNEEDVGFDLDCDGAMTSTIALTIEHDPDAYPETNGYYGTYLDLYLAEFIQNLQWYVDNLDYAEGWTWFGPDGNALSNEAVAAMTAEEKTQAFLEGRCTTSGGKSMGMMGGMAGGFGRPDGDFPGGFGGRDDEIDGDFPGGMGGRPGGGPNGDVVGTPDAGTTQSATGRTDSAGYASYEEMVAAYKADIEEVYGGDQYGNNIVSLYNPLNYIGAEGTKDPTWTKLLMGASEGDISMFNSLNLRLVWLGAGVDAQLEWQWNGGHVPTEVLGESFSLYVDQMYGKHVEGTVSITKPLPEKQTANGSSEAASNATISSWVSMENGKVSFSLADAAAYRTLGASKAMPGFDVIDYGQEDYVFGNKEKDARHWNIYLLEIFEHYADVLSPLFSHK